MEANGEGVGGEPCCLDPIRFSILGSLCEGESCQLAVFAVIVMQLRSGSDAVPFMCRTYGFHSAAASESDLRNRKHYPCFY